MNQVLGKWIYRREDIRGAELQKVSLEDPRRGGIFTLPGLMTATANGVDTSPVVRGVWVLENILGTPPAPPPPDVEPLPTDTRGASSIRKRLDLHRKNEACASCHHKIDPMGFAFENFDVVGRWRDKYRGDREDIDASAVMANGDKITTSKFSKANPIGSILWWQLAQASFFRCKSNRFRMLLAPLVSVGKGSTSGGGGAGGVPKIFSKTQTPRTTGEVSTPLAVAVISPGKVKIPPRRGSSKETFCNSAPRISSRR
jgi:hypothetical protein